jgi:hypothetical protein
MDKLPTAEMTGSLQSKEHAFDLVGLDSVIREPRHVLGKQIGRSLNIGDTMLRREPTDRRPWSSASLFQGARSWLVLTRKYNISCPENPLAVRSYLFPLSQN